VKSPILRIPRRFAVGQEIIQGISLSTSGSLLACFRGGKPWETLPLNPKKQVEVPDMCYEEDFPVGNGHALEFM
jgi:hypothetical protein